MKLKLSFAIPALLIGMLFAFNADAQSKACCSKKAEASKACCSKKDASATKADCTSSANNTKTSGCTPSNCRGAKTKFGEAKVISKLREVLVALKADMEQSKTPEFSARSYDIHGIVGESDKESVAIIINEVEIIEKEFGAKLKSELPAFSLPDSEAKKVAYLNERISALHEMLKS